MAMIPSNNFKYPQIKADILNQFSGSQSHTTNNKNQPGSIIYILHDMFTLLPV